MAPGIAVTSEKGCSWMDASLIHRLHAEMAQEVILKEDQSLREHDLLVDHRHSSRRSQHNPSQRTAIQASLLNTLLNNGGEVLEKVASGLKPSTGCEKSILAMISVLDAAGITETDFLSSNLAELQNTSKVYAGTPIGKALLKLLQKSSRCFEAAVSRSLPSLSAC